jgi:carbamoyl-phosphate synthase large subunit
MTGAGAPGAAGIIHCLQSDPSIQVVVADADEHATGRYLVSDFVQIPKADDPGFAEVILGICLDRRIDVVLPLVTKELFPFSKNKKRFEEEGISVLVSSEEAIAIANNKSACYRFLKNKGIDVPKFFVAKTVEEFIHAAFELGHPQKQFCFKPSVSNGSRGVRIVADSLNEADQLFHFKPYNLYMTYAHALKILSCEPFPELLVSEYLPGDE